jgi:prepilin-type N-terminal cleavage/methylation domain-containing protein
MKRNQSGFTLIEIAIVLVIIGLLLGGVLKGQELINSAKVKNLATDFRNIPVYIYGYQDKFRAVPGDDAAAASHVTGAQSCGAITANCNPGNGLIEGTWDSLDTTGTVESQLFWQHVRMAGLAVGPTLATSDLLPTNSVGGVIGITSIASFGDPNLTAAAKLNGTYVICSAGILGKFAKQLDLQMDDGSANTGSMREFSQAGGRGTALAIPAGAYLEPSGQISDSQTFTVCMGV